MSELSLSSNPKKPQFFTSLLYNFYHFCIFILSHPLYFFYFIFFLPYLLKFLSFLSPLFITTSLLLAFLTLSPTTFHGNLNFESLWPKVGSEIAEFRKFDEIEEAYNTLFGPFPFENSDKPVEVSEVEIQVDIESTNDKNSIHGSHGVSKLSESPNGKNPEENQAEITHPTITHRVPEFLEEKKEPENKFCMKEEKKVQVQIRETNKVEEHEEKPSMKVESKEFELGTKEMENSEAFESNLGSYGSMRKEKEWRRTLACKLFEERHKPNGGEGMDLLWETYETESNRVKSKLVNSKKEKKNGIMYNEEEEEEEEEEEIEICCLQALKFSTGKMNLGMGKPNFLKISKAFKGIGWLHNVSRHKGKVYR